ncbi:hypothetical protein BDR03DRAFT_957579, partial [Suillus americanus]
MNSLDFLVNTLSISLGIPCAVVRYCVILPIGTVNFLYNWGPYRMFVGFVPYPCA